MPRTLHGGGELTRYNGNCVKQSAGVGLERVQAAWALTWQEQDAEQVTETIAWKRRGAHASDVRGDALRLT